MVIVLAKLAGGKWNGRGSGDNKGYGDIDGKDDGQSGS